MTDIKLPPIPPVATWPLFPDALRARDIEVAKLVLEAAAKLCDAVAVDATSEKRTKFLSMQGKAVYEGMYGGAINCAGGIRNLEISYD